MSYGFYLVDICNFDDLVGWLMDHIKETYDVHDLVKSASINKG
jgi:hypothetical protein